MKERVVHILAMCFFIIGGTFVLYNDTACAAEKSEVLSAEIYELDEDSKYVFENNSVATQVTQQANRVRIVGDMTSVASDQGMISYAVNEGNLEIFLNKEENGKIYSETIENETVWHIVPDKSKVVNGVSLDEKIGTGALIIQTSKDNKVWVNAQVKTDIFNNVMQKDEVIYCTEGVQLKNGCYYRIIIAYKMERKVESSKIIFFEKKNYEKKECAEVYTFYAYDKNVDLNERLDTANAYKFYDVARAEAEGYAGEGEMKIDDPHYGWKIGEFWVSGYTGKIETEDGRIVFLKEVGDKASLWFQLEQDINQCNGNANIRVCQDTAGSDRYFQTSVMDFGHGTLIVKKIDYQNNVEQEIYTNYLEASASVGANTRVNLFEEGDYEVALDYMLEYDKTKILGKAVMPKRLCYRVAFNFSVRNGDCKLFVRDAKNNQFMENEDITENGFYIDLAKSKYLSLLVKREIMKDSLDGLVTDTKFNGAATEGRMYTDEGIYTIKATNQYTSATTEKKIYVGNEEVLRAYIKTGLSINTINEMISAGAHIDEEGNIIEAEIWRAHVQTELPIEEINAKVNSGAYIDEEGNIIESKKNVESEKSIEEVSQVISNEVIDEKEIEQKIAEEPIEIEEPLESVQEEAVTENISGDTEIKEKGNPIVFIVIIMTFGASGMTVYLKRKKTNREERG